MEYIVLEFIVFSCKYWQNILFDVVRRAICTVDCTYVVWQEKIFYCDFDIISPMAIYFEILKQNFIFGENVEI